MLGHARAAVGVAALIGVSLCAALAVAGPSPQKSVHDGVFTPAQVEAGKEVFEAVCLDCHTTDVFGPDYMTSWSGASLGEFFVSVQATMPYENPGGLEDKDYAAVIVYLFSLNGVAAGENELPTEVGELYEITIDGPFKWIGTES